MSYNRTQCAN